LDVWILIPLKDGDIELTTLKSDSFQIKYLTYLHYILNHVKIFFARRFIDFAPLYVPNLYLNNLQILFKELREFLFSISIII